MSSHLPVSEEENLLDNATSTWTSACLTELMSRHGVAARHQATVVAQICAISVSQARRKLRGAVWLFNEVLALCQHFHESLDTVFASGMQDVTPQQDATVQPGATAPTCPATLVVDAGRVDCEIQLGAIRASLGPAADVPALLATHQACEGWLVASPGHMARQAPEGPHYAVQWLQIRAPQEQSPARIAVLDDDAGSAHALTDWFNEVGYHAEAYTHPDQLPAAALKTHDAYVIDLILGAGQTSQGVVERIRQAQPMAPIVLLTGQLKDGTASEAQLSTLLRTQGVTFFEKPVRPAVLTAAIQSGLDKLATTHD